MTQGCIDKNILVIFMDTNFRFDNLEQIKEIQIAIQLLRKSRTRFLVLNWLASIYPRASYSMEIARNTHLHPTQVIGALKGVGKQYSIDNSLCARKLCEVAGKNSQTIWYRATQRGCEVLRLFQHKP